MKNEKSEETNTSDSATRTLFKLSDIKNKKVELTCQGNPLSSDGGGLLLHELTKHVNIIDSVSSCINDLRDQRYTTHSIHELISQRSVQIACGYEDGNDSDELRNDSVMKIFSGRLPESDPDLASQPTMSRLENSITRSELYRIAQVFINHFISSYAVEPGIIILDCDDTNYNAHGDQQQTLFNGYYGEYCYLPLHIYEGFSGKLIATLLEPGRRSKNAEVFAVLKRVITVLRKHWKNTIIVVRGDSHFCCHDLMDWSLQQNNIRFITGLSGNAKLKEMSANTVKKAKSFYDQTKEPVKLYSSFNYKAGSWNKAYRVVVKVEVSSLGVNVRYIVSSWRKYSGQTLYERGYCPRGIMELRIKDHKLYLKSDRASCSRFQANQFRLFLHSIAYVLIHTLQKEVLKGTEFENSTMGTIQLKLFKVGAFIRELKNKIKIELPKSYRYQEIYKLCLQRFEVLRI